MIIIISPPVDIIIISKKLTSLPNGEREIISNDINETKLATTFITLEDIIKGYYVEKRGLNVQVKIEDFKCSANYWNEANS